MAAHRLYLLHPVEQYLPGAAEWVAEVRAILQEDPAWNDWDFFIAPYDERNSFHVQPLFVRVLTKQGPVVLVESVQRKALEELRRRLRTRAIVMTEFVGDSTDLLGVLVESRRRFDSGEPFLPRKFVLAVLIVRKLRKGNYWAGKEKGYLWHDDLAKGRGVDERYADIAHVVANDLLQHEILIFKTSQGKKKYALNPDRKPEVHAIANDGTFWNERLEEILMADTQEVSAYLLNEPRTAQGFIIAADGQPTFECVGIAEAVAYAQDCLECAKYEVQVKFEGNHNLHEIITTKHILIQFMEGFQ
jgi:hypothetical protein